MHKIFIPILFLLIFVSAFAQDEQLSDLPANTKLYYSTKPFQTAKQHKYLIEKGSVIVQTDTLSLPFVDDFSSNNLRSYRWIENNITDTFYNVFGTCLGPEGVATVNGTFSTVRAWYYSYDTLTHTIDSTSQDSIRFTFFGPSTSACFQQAPQTIVYWNQYYTYTFDSAGQRTDSTLVTSNTTGIDYSAVVYFAQAESGKLWFDNYAYVNNTYPVNPPTIGVATLDGLNEFGLPYNGNSITTYGTADYLTSLPIDLSALYPHDSSLYLSFFYQAMGLGDFPDKDDTLIVEFRDNSGQWNIVWSDTGYSSIANVPQVFKQVLLHADSLPFPLTYYHNAFQFRFRNKASLYGNNDHWHIDYVEFDKNRSATDSSIQDIAFVYPFTTILRNFTQMPADQFNYPADLCDTVTLTTHNLDPNANNNPPATNFVRGAQEFYPNTAIVATDVLQTFNAASENTLEVYPSADYSLSFTNYQIDSLVLQARVLVTPFDSRPGNDTVYCNQNFSSVMAYDDGSAEKAYGISGVGLKKFGYEFNLNQPDTLAGFQIHFAQVDVSVDDLIFNFYAWDSIRLNDYTFDDATTQIYARENQKPIYVDSTNGFASYKLDTPIVVQNKLYFGWSQNDDRSLQVGYDLNSTLGKPHMFRFTGTTWKPSNINPVGSPMIRLIFDGNWWGGNTGVRDNLQTKLPLKIYPNPTSDLVYIVTSKKDASFTAVIYDMWGQVVSEAEIIDNTVSLGNLPSGTYILRILDRNTGNGYPFRVIKL